MVCSSETAFVGYLKKALFYQLIQQRTDPSFGFWSHTRLDDDLNREPCADSEHQEPSSDDLWHAIYFTSSEYLYSTSHDSKLRSFFFFLCDGLYLQDEKSELPKLTVTAYSSRQAELSAKLELPSHPLYVCSSRLTAPRWPRSSRLCTCVTLNPSLRSGRAQADISAAWKNSSQCFSTAGFYCCCCTLDRSAHANISLSGWLDMFLLKRTTTLTKEKSTSSLFYLVNLKCAICKNLKNVKKWHFMYEWYRDLCWVSMLTKPLSSPYLYEVVNKSQLIRMLTALSGYSGDVLPPICL